MTDRLKSLLDEVLTVDDIIAVSLTTVAANVDLTTHPLAQQIVTSALAATSIVALVANKIHERITKQAPPASVPGTMV